MNISKEGWARILLDIYDKCRKNPHWDVVFNLHDKEDQDYFLMLDESHE